MNATADRIAPRARTRTAGALLAALVTLALLVGLDALAGHGPGQDLLARAQAAQRA